MPKPLPDLVSRNRAEHRAAQFGFEKKLAATMTHAQARDILTPWLFWGHAPQDKGQARAALRALLAMLEDDTP